VEIAAAKRRPSRMRADASRNRERIVTAAREALVESGPDVPMDDIARRAGVGNATLYRNFPDRRELFRTVTLSVLDRAAECGEVALKEESDAFAALERFVHEVADERIGAQSALLSGVFDPDDPELAAARVHLAQVVETLLERARVRGQLRDDIAVGDLMVALCQLTRPLPGTACISIDQFVHRHLQLFLDGLRAPARSTLPGYSAKLEDLRREP
jgi:AcrR family transcriptional regulator